MSKTTAPLLSFDASGQIGKTMVASSWKGIRYMRRYVKPANPNTTAQQTVRSTFALIREMYKLAPSILREPWDAFARGRPFTGMNKFVGENVRVLNGDANMNDFIFSPGSGGGLAPTGLTTDGSVANQITATVTVPSAPVGWTLTAVQFAIFLDQDPSGIFNGEITAAEDLAGPYVQNFSGLTSAVVYQVGAWIKWTKPDGSFAYSVSLSAQETPA